MLQNRLATALAITSLVLLAGIVLYMFGTPTATSSAPSVSASTTGPDVSSVAPPNQGGAPAVGEVVDGEVPPPDPSSPLAIEIPGCTCHSDDPEIVAEHEQYRMNQCAGCHVGGMPMDGG